MKKGSKSRKQTPWDGIKDVTATQEFLRTHYQARYEERHPTLQDAGEAALINSYRPACCPYCGSEDFISKGYDSLGCSDTNVFVAKGLSLPREQYLTPEKSPFLNG